MSSPPNHPLQQFLPTKYLQSKTRTLCGALLILKTILDNEFINSSNPDKLNLQLARYQFLLSKQFKNQF